MFGQEDQKKVLKTQLHNYLNVIHQKQKFSGEILVAKGDDILFQEAPIKIIANPLTNYTLDIPTDGIATVILLNGISGILNDGRFCGIDLDVFN